MKDMGEASYVIGIKIHRDRSCRTLGISQKAYVKKVLDRFQMSDCTTKDLPIIKDDKYNLNQCPKSDAAKRHGNCSICFCCKQSYVYSCRTKSDIAFVLGMLGRYQNNPIMTYWKMAKRVIRYLRFSAYL